MLYTIRRIDLIIQATIVLLCIATTIFAGLTFLFAGEFVLGIVQIISAVLNTPAMLQTNYRARIKLYWLFTVIALGAWLLPFHELITISAFASWGIAIYYWLTYKSFLDFLDYRKELSTVTK